MVQVNAGVVVNICVGSMNPNKQAAVKRAFASFSQFQGSSFSVFSADSGVSDQPLGYEESFKGADARAKGAFESGEFSFGVGLESGLIEAPGSTTGHMNMTVCSIFDGKRFYRGSGPGFELPEAVCRMVAEEGLELDEAVHRAGLSENARIGYAEGIIGVLSGGCVTREDYMVPAVTMALVALCSKWAGRSHG